MIAVILLAGDRPDHLAATRCWWSYELIVGALVGAAIGFAGAWLLRREALPAAGLYPLATIALIGGAYAVGTFAHASGFLAVYVAAVILGNSRLPHRASTLSFAEGLGWLAQIGLFVMLGLYVEPSRLPAALISGHPDRADRAAGGPADLGVRRRAAVPAAVAGAGVPVLVGAARRGADRAGTIPLM